MLMHCISKKKVASFYVKETDDHCCVLVIDLKFSDEVKTKTDDLLLSIRQKPTYIDKVSNFTK